MPAKGIQRVRRNFKIAIDGIENYRTEAAIYAVLSQGASAASQMTPVDTSTLINSQYEPQIRANNGKVSGTVGYTAAYAAAVHEAPGTLKGQNRADFGKTSEGVAFGGGSGVGKYWDPNAEPKFLSKGFKQIKSSIPAILKQAYRV